MNAEHFEHRYFSPSEAEGKVGKRVQTRIDFSGVPRGTQGVVISADPAGAARVEDTSENVYDVAVQWDKDLIETALSVLARRLEKIDENENQIERTEQRDQLLEQQDTLMFMQSQNSLVDWFTKEEYERYLDELPQISETQPNKR
jgi:hypothetical protein